MNMTSNTPLNIPAHNTMNMPSNTPMNIPPHNTMIVNWELDEVNSVLQGVYASMISLLNTSIYNRRIHNMLIDFLLVDMYNYAPHGRIGSFARLTKQDAISLCEHGE